MQIVCAFNVIKHVIIKSLAFHNNKFYCNEMLMKYGVPFKDSVYIRLPLITKGTANQRTKFSRGADVDTFLGVVVSFREYVVFLRRSV